MFINNTFSHIKMQEINSKQFEKEVLQAKILVIVDNFATWCGPCKALSPILEDLNKDFKGKVKFVKIDVDQNPDIARKYRVSSIPTLILFKDGEVKDEVIGLRTKDDLEEWINDNL